MKLLLALILSGWSFAAMADWKTYNNGYHNEVTGLFVSLTLSGDVSFQTAEQTCANGQMRLATWDELQSGRSTGLADVKRQNDDDASWWFWTEQGQRFSLEGLHIPGTTAKTICTILR